MKLLRICAEGLPLFKENLDISFIATQRVSEDDKDKLQHLFSNIYLNPTEALIGINASGKTSALKVILLALELVNNEPINHMESKDILGKAKNAVIRTWFYTAQNELYNLCTTISYTGSRYVITDEALYQKDAAQVKIRKTIFEFSENMLLAKRTGKEEFLPDDVSIVIAENRKKNNSLAVTSMLSFTNMNILPASEKIPPSIISFLDPTVESLWFEEKGTKQVVHLKFFGQEDIVLSDSRELEIYLSSGTIKGIIVFSAAMSILKAGGYMVIDEIENHFNKEIVTTLIRFFMDTRLNKNGAVMIFTTHYPELLDEYDRNDSIFITRNRTGITVDNLTTILSRNDIKKSDAYQSGFLEGTTPAYEAYMQLKKSLAAAL